jgi:hypothetical protein
VGEITVFNTQFWGLNLPTFSSLAKSELARRGIACRDDEQLAMIMADWKQSEGVDVAKFENVADAFNSFVRFLGSYQPPVPALIACPAVEISFDYNIGVMKGHVTLTFANESGDLGKTIPLAMRQAEMALDALKQKYKLIEVVPQSTASVPGQVPQGGTAEMQSEVLIHLFDGQAHKIRIAGGRWRKFGVPVYPEVMNAVGINADKLPLGETPFVHNCIVAIKPDGNPVKVLQVK